MSWHVVVVVAACMLGACASAPVAAVSATDPFVVCMAPIAVVITRDDDTAVVERFEADAPNDVLRFQDAADRCGAWRLGDDIGGHVRAIVALSRCGEDCPSGWEAQLARAMGRAAPSAARQQCRTDDGPDWAGWAIARLMDVPDLAPERRVARAVLLARAGIGSVDDFIGERLDAAPTDEAAALARATRKALPSADESLQFHAAMALVRAGDLANGRDWLNQLALSGRTAFRAFARAELDALEHAP